jgi:hypothetical protein
MDRSCFLGIDIGTFESKGVITGPDGNVIISHACRHIMESPKPGYAEHDAVKTWWADFCEISNTLIEKSKIDGLLEDAWNIGQNEADKFLGDHKSEARLFMPDILVREGFKIFYINEDYIVGKRRYFCEYLSEKNTIKVYQKSVRLWCDSNGLDYEQGLSILLAHEYFHYLEWHRIGLTSKRYQVPMLKFGRWQIGKTGVAALSEIAANAFSYKYYVHMNYVEGEDWLKHD